MAQFARPSTDTTRDNWVEDDDTTTNIFDQIDEASLDDADYIRTVVAPTADVYVTKLTTVEDPLSSSNHTVRIRRSKDAAGGATINLTVELRQGYTNEGAQGTLIATVMNAVSIDENWTTTSYTLTGGEADSITDYSDLYLRFVGTQA